MPVLTKQEILHYLLDKQLEFNPKIDQFQLQPHAIDLRLGFEFFIPRAWELNSRGRCALNINYLDFNGDQNFEQVTLSPGQFFEILPTETVIAKTLEHVSINSGQLMAILYPRSSLNRRGLAMDLTGVVDSRYAGHLIIPIKNNTNQIIRLYPGERICSLVFETLESELSLHQAQMHGLNQAKYAYTKDHAFKNDLTECEYIKTGDIEGLKRNFFLN